MSNHKFLFHNFEDHVGVAVEEIKAGAAVMGAYLEGDDQVNVTANQDIPLGHKIALKPAKQGDIIVKYGENIGKATQDIKVGDWVHTHNLKTARWDYGN